MNTKNQPIKLRNRVNLTDVYYTLSQWPSKEIDGVLFLPVVRNYPSDQKQPIHYVRKDSLEKTK